MLIIKPSFTTMVREDNVGRGHPSRDHDTSRSHDEQMSVGGHERHVGIIGPSGGASDECRVRETPPPQRTLHKDRMGGDLLLFTHLLVEVMFLKS